MTNSELKKLEFLVVHPDSGEVKRMKGTDKLSPNFLVYEFASTDGCPVVVINDWCIRKAQAVRDKVAHACKIGRGFSSIPDNERIYQEAIKKGYVASRTSTHTLGEAVDIQPADKFRFRYTEEEWFNVVEGVVGWDSGMGSYPSHVHFDHEERRRW